MKGWEGANVITQRMRRAAPERPRLSASPNRAGGGCFHRRWGGLAIGLSLLGLVTGCSGPPRKPRELPPLPSAYAEIHQLNARAFALATLRLTGTLKLHYIDRLGNKQDYQVHGVLLVDQSRRVSPPLIPLVKSAGGAASVSRRQTAASGLKMLLVGTYLGQDVVEMGLNRKVYWLIEHRQGVAYIGSTAKADRLPPGVMPLRPTRVLALLGITALSDSVRQYVVMGASADSPDLHLFVVRRLRKKLFSTNGGRGSFQQQVFPGSAWLQRELTVDRYTGQITQVMLFDRQGRAVARSRLSDYRPVAAGGQKPVASGPRVPFHIVIRYPAGRATLRWRLSKAALTLRGKPKFIFATPSFQGVRVIDVDDPANWPK